MGDMLKLSWPNLDLVLSRPEYTNLEQVILRGGPQGLV